MTEKINVKLNKNEVNKMLRGQGPYRGVREDLERRIQRMADAAGPGHSTSVEDTPNRLRASIWTSSDAAREAEQQDLNLTRSIDSGRGD